MKISLQYSVEILSNSRFWFGKEMGILPCLSGRSINEI